MRATRTVLSVRLLPDEDATPPPWNIPLNSGAGPCGIVREKEGDTECMWCE